MSFQAVSWAARQTTGGPTGKLVLMMLAQFADDEGVCFPGQLKLAEMCELHERIVRKWLSILEAKGLIRRERRYRESSYRTSDRIFLLMNSPAPEACKNADSPAPEASKRAILPALEAGEAEILPAFKADLTGSRSRAINSKGNSQREIEGNARERTPDDWFDVFWSVYPKREGGNPKKPARDKFLKALARGADPVAIVKGASAYARVYPEVSAFVAHATTWLNQERWTDDYGTQAPRAPPRVNGTGRHHQSQHEVLQAGFDLVRAERRERRQ